jgi:hypothetical protein
MLSRRAGDDKATRRIDWTACRSGAPSGRNRTDAGLFFDADAVVFPFCSRLWAPSMLCKAH